MCFIKGLRSTNPLSLVTQDGDLAAIVKFGYISQEDRCVRSGWSITGWVRSGKHVDQALDCGTKLSPNMLSSNPEHERIFKQLVSDCFDFTKSWGHLRIDEHMQRMYGRRKRVDPALDVGIHIHEQVRKGSGTCGIKYHLTSSFTTFNSHPDGFERLSFDSGIVASQSMQNC